MKRSREKSRTPARLNAVPCDPTRVKMGNSYSSPPEFWVTTTRTCVACDAQFVVTAVEQQTWHEVFGIPWVVSINRCLPCRRRQRNRRRIINRLAELMPAAEQGSADERQLREIVLIIAEGTIRRDVVKYYSDEELVLSHKPVLLKGTAFINQLLQAKRPQTDLLVIQRHFQHHLGNVVRAQRLADEIKRVRTAPALGNAISAIESWLQDPTKKAWSRIIEPPRL